MKSYWQDISNWRYIAIFISIFLLGMNFSFGLIDFSDDAELMIQKRDSGAALALPLIAGFAMLFFPIINLKAQSAILITATMSNSPLRYARIYARMISQIPRHIIRPCVLVGSVIAITYLSFEGLIYIDELSVADNLLRSVLLIEACYMWTAICLVFTSVYQVTKLVSRYIERHLRVELFHIDELVPLAQAVFWNTVFLSSALALSPIFWLGGEAPIADLILVMLVFVAVLAMMFYPLYRIRSIVVLKKRQALERIQGAIKEAMRTNSTEQRRLVDSVERLNEINNLVNVRDEISRTREWPLNSHVSFRFLMVFFLPPSSWAAASIVDWFVKQIIV